jgi:shikimate kinase
MDETTRAAMKTLAFTIWLKAPVEILLGRVKKRQGADQTRPLLANEDMRGTLEKLLAAREPVYAGADMVLESGDEPHAVLLDKIVAALAAHGLCEEP